MSPVSGVTLQSYEEMTPEQLEAALAKTDAAQKEWSRTRLPDRARRLESAASELRKRKDELARMMAREMGKPLAQGKSEVEKCAWVCEYYAEKGEEFLAPQEIESDARRSFVTFKPLGVVLAVMPWNFPFWQVFRFAAPALMAGNGGLLKHAANVPGCALAIEEILRAAGFPEHLFRTLMIPKEKVACLLEDPRVAAATLTGSTGAGKAVASKAGEELKKTVLELGGSDAYVILEDADVSEAAKVCTDSRLINSGQSCIAAKRFVVVEAVREAFEEEVVARMAEKTLGDPLDPDTEIGPLARGTCGTSSMNRWKKPWPAAPAVCWEERSRKAPVPFTRRRS